MLSDLPALTRWLPLASAPARTPARRPATPVPVGLAEHHLHRDVCLEPGNLVEVCERLGAQQFSLVDGEVTFTARSGARVQRWRGRIGVRGLIAG